MIYTVKESTNALKQVTLSEVGFIFFVSNQTTFFFLAGN